VGIGIVEKTDAMGHNDHLYERAHSAFFDYTADASSSKPVAGIPAVTGKGTVTIKNGIIKNGTLGTISWGIQSTAEDVMVVLDNVKIMNSGINATAADLLQATITKCSFEVENPFIINRHGSEFYAVDLRGNKSSEVSYSEFIGGQGCLAFKGSFSKVHHNFFANCQTVTNHYSIMAMGDSSLIFENLIKPEIGSGIEIFRHKYIEIFNNEIHIQAAPPTCEYGHDGYSVNALRVADYNSPPGAPDGCFGNKIYNNKIYITGKDYPEYLDYTPMAYAMFYSASAGENYIFGNYIQVEDLTVGLKNEATGFYIGGGTIGGQFFDNRIITNVPAVWVACPYGGATNTKLYDNKIIKSKKAKIDFQPIRMGWAERKDCVSKDVEFRSNTFEGFDFGVEATDQLHSYSVWWTITVNVTEVKGKDVLVQILDSFGDEAFREMVNNKDLVLVELPEYTVDEHGKVFHSPYTVIVGRNKTEVRLDGDKEVTFK
jgi:hypothetical protein